MLEVHSPRIAARVGLDCSKRLSVLEVAELKVQGYTQVCRRLEDTTKKSPSCLMAASRFGVILIGFQL